MRLPPIAIAFVILLLLGFLPTPDVTKFMIPGYVLAVHQQGEALHALEQQISELSVKISDDASKIIRLAADATLAPDAAKKDELSAQVTVTTAEKNQFEDQKKSLEKLYLDKQTNIENAAKDKTNLSLVIRALALGAIGALFSIFAQYLTVTKTGTRFRGTALSEKTWASMAMGAIVAVVVIGLFYTGFISIFADAEKATGTPDFWKVTILSLIAGAFADRLFQAASYRVGRYIGQSGNVSTNPDDSPPRRSGKHSG